MRCDKLFAFDEEILKLSFRWPAFVNKAFFTAGLYFNTLWAWRLMFKSLKYEALANEFGNYVLN